MDEGQMEERRATVQVHVVAVDRPKPSTKHAIIYWQIETIAEATASMGGYGLVRNEWQEKIVSRIELIQEIRKREMCRYLLNAFK